MSLLSAALLEGPLDPDNTEVNPSIPFLCHYLCSLFKKIIILMFFITIKIIIIIVIIIIILIIITIIIQMIDRIMHNNYNCIGNKT